MRPFQHVIEYITRGDSYRISMFSPYITNTGGDILFPWHECKSGEIRLHDNVGKTALPVAHLEVGQHCFRDIPAKDHIALRKPFFQRVQEVLRRDTLPTEDTFDIGCTN